MSCATLGIPELETSALTGDINTGMDDKGTMMNNDVTDTVIRWTSEHDTMNAERREDSKSIGVGIDGGDDEHILLEKVLS